MKRFAILAAVTLALTGCDKPSSESCEKALRNMQALLGTDNLATTESIQGEVRRCRGGSTKDAVDCAIKATTLEELEHCEFERDGRHAGSAANGGSAGSATGAAGSAK